MTTTKMVRPTRPYDACCAVLLAGDGVGVVATDVSAAMTSASSAMAARHVIGRRDVIATSSHPVTIEATRGDSWRRTDAEETSEMCVCGFRVNPG